MAQNNNYQMKKVLQPKITTEELLALAVQAEKDHKAGKTKLLKSLKDLIKTA